MLKGQKQLTARTLYSTDSWVEKEGFLMYGKIPCKKLKYASQKVK